LVYCAPSHRLTARELHALLEEDGAELSLAQTYHVLDALEAAHLVRLSDLDYSDLLDIMVSAGHLPATCLSPTYRPMEAFLTTLGLERVQALLGSEQEFKS
jgi:hypothetical protein